MGSMHSSSSWICENCIYPSLVQCMCSCFFLSISFNHAMHGGSSLWYRVVPLAVVVNVYPCFSSSISLLVSPTHCVIYGNLYFPLDFPSTFNPFLTKQALNTERIEKVCFLVPKCFLFLADPDACAVFVSRFLRFRSDIFGVGSYDSDLKLLDSLAPFNWKKTHFPFWVHHHTSSKWLHFFILLRLVFFAAYSVVSAKVSFVLLKLVSIPCFFSSFFISGFLVSNPTRFYSTWFGFSVFSLKKKRMLHVPYCST